MYTMVFKKMFLVLCAVLHSINANCRSWTFMSKKIGKQFIALSHIGFYTFLLLKCIKKTVIFVLRLLILKIMCHCRLMWFAVQLVLKLYSQALWTLDLEKQNRGSLHSAFSAGCKHLQNFPLPSQRTLWFGKFWSAWMLPQDVCSSSYGLSGGMMWCSSDTKI